MQVNTIFHTPFGLLNTCLRNQLIRQCFICFLNEFTLTIFIHSKLEITVLINGHNIVEEGVCLFITHMLQQKARGP